jgi:hypothetical protein
MFACTNSKKLVDNLSESNAINWEFGQVKALDLYSAQSTDTTIASIEYTLLPQNDVLKPLVDSLIRVHLGDESKENITKLYLQNVVNEFIREYKEFKNSEESYLTSWYYHSSIDLCEVKKNYLKVDLNTELYTGGAHGNRMVNHYMIKKVSQQTITLKDICTDITLLTKLAEIKFRKFVEIDTVADLNENGFWFTDNRFYLPENFYFDEEGLTFVFNQYEVAPYVYGLIYIEFNWNEINSIVKI